MSLNFFIDFERDLNYIGEELNQIIGFIGEEEVKKLFRRYYPSCDYPPLQSKSFFVQNKENLLQKLEEKKHNMEKTWKKEEKWYFKKIEEMTGYPWKYKHYDCHLSSTYVCGGGYELPRLVIIFPFATHVNKIQGIMHELFHLHFWDIVERKRLKPSENMVKLHHISETIANVILNDIGFEYQDGLEFRKVKKAWDSKKDFDALLEKFVINFKYTKGTERWKHDKSG